MRSDLFTDCLTSARGELQTHFGQECFERWLADITVLPSDEGHVRLGVANRFLQEWIESRYLDGIKEVLEGQAGRELDLDIAIDPVLFRKQREEQKRLFSSGGAVEVSPARRIRARPTAWPAGPPWKRPARPGCSTIRSLSGEDQGLEKPIFFAASSPRRKPA